MNFVPGAPLFNINSVRVDGADTFTAAQWISLIKNFKDSFLTREEIQAIPYELQVDIIFIEKRRIRKFLVFLK
jgi:hypothetical protein